jgi:hypothetical protein
MPWFKTCFLLLLTSSAWAIEDYAIGLGIESDDAGGTGVAGFADIGLRKNTRFSLLFGKTRLDLLNDLNLNTTFGDIGVDHYFDPIGLRVELAYWGDSDIFDSIDWRGAMYWRNDTFSVSGDLEYRQFEFDIFRDDVLAGQDIRFNAKGYGLSSRIRLNDRFSLNLRGINYDYDVDLRLDADRRIVNLLSTSRLSLINSLVSYRVSAGLGIKMGRNVLSFSVANWKGEVDGRTTLSSTVKFLTPLGKTRDIEFGLGVDDSDAYGSVAFFSVYLYFYGG